MPYAEFIARQDADIIPFPKGQFEHQANKRAAALDELPVTVERGSKTKCSHQRSSLNEHDRTVNCRDCGVPLDPIDVLRRLANSREYLVRQGMSLRHEVDSLSKTVEALKRDEKNTKARLRNAEHPTLKEARLSLKEAGDAFWAVQGMMQKLGVEESDSKLYQQVISAWQRCRRVADKLRPSQASAG